MTGITIKQRSQPPITAAGQSASAGFAITFAFTFLSLIFGLALVNILGNGAGLFPSRINPSMSDRPWKSRRLAEHALETNSPQVLVMGSSRMMQVQPPYLAAITGKRAFNYAVSAAGPVDWLAQLRYAVSLGIKPDLIVVGVDEFGFGDIFNRYELQIAGDWGLFKCVSFPENVQIARNVLMLMNVEATGTSLAVLAHPPTVHLRSMKRVTNILLDDGYLIYRDKTAAKKAGTYDVKKLIRHQAINWKLALAKEHAPIDVLRPTERKLQLFDEFLALARANGTEVRVLLLPLQPEYERETLTQQMRKIRSGFGVTLQSLCLKHGCIYRDFTSLSSFGGSKDEFWDGAHQTPENLRRMMNVLFGLPPARVVSSVPTDEAILEHPPKTTTLNSW